MILTITNGKGGTGKTTLNTYVAEYLFAHGKKVLIIDLDANCSISEIYDFVLKEQNSRLLLTGIETTPYTIKTNVNGGKLSIIPSDLNLSMLSNIKDTQLKYQIKKQNFATDYDYVLIDPPGTWSAQTRNAVFAADTIVVCGKCSPLDFAATQNYMSELQECCLESEIYVVCNSYNPKHDPNNILQKYKDTFGEFLIQDPVPLLNTFQRIVFDPSYKVNGNITKRLNSFIRIITGKEWE